MTKNYQITDRGRKFLMVAETPSDALRLHDRRFRQCSPIRGTKPEMTIFSVRTDYPGESSLGESVRQVRVLEIPGPVTIEDYTLHTGRPEGVLHSIETYPGASVREVLLRWNWRLSRMDEIGTFLRKNGRTDHEFAVSERSGRTWRAVVTKGAEVWEKNPQGETEEGRVWAITCPCGEIFRDVAVRIRGDVFNRYQGVTCPTCGRIRTLDLGQPGRE